MDQASLPFDPARVRHHLQSLFAKLDDLVQVLQQTHDYVLIDTPAGTEGAVRWALDKADLGILVLVGEPTAISDAYRLARMIWDIEPNYPPTHDRRDCHTTICTQCGERPASREGILRSTPSPQQLLAVNHAAHHQHYARQVYLLEKSPSLQHNYPPEMTMSLQRHRPIPMRARSEERGSMGREW